MEKIQLLKEVSTLTTEGYVKFCKTLCPVLQIRIKAVEKTILFTNSFVCFYKKKKRETCTLFNKISSVARFYINADSGCLGRIFRRRACQATIVDGELLKKF